MCKLFGLNGWQGNEPRLHDNNTNTRAETLTTTYSVSKNVTLVTTRTSFSILRESP